jgi:hypothetical protein
MRIILHTNINTDIINERMWILITAAYDGLISLYNEICPGRILLGELHPERFFPKERFLLEDNSLKEPFKEPFFYQWVQLKKEGSLFPEYTCITALLVQSALLYLVR